MALRFKVPSAPMLAHFTKASPRADALDNLVSILARGTVQGSSRMIFGKKRVVCLFNATVTELSELLDRRNRRRYQPFGLAIDRRHAFRMGARPAIYLPRAEASKLLPVGELWRVVALQIDWA